jgi:hypothetical protein
MFFRLLGRERTPVVDSAREYFHPYPLMARPVVADERWPGCEFRCPSPAGQASLGFARFHRRFDLQFTLLADGSDCSGRPWRSGWGVSYEAP